MIDQTAPELGAGTPTISPAARGPLALVVVSPNQPATGTVSITGSPVQGQTLTASNTFADGNGMGTVTYQWMADGVPILGATGASLVLSTGEVAEAITVVASFTDQAGYSEGATSSPTTAVLGLNSAPVFAHDAPGTWSSHIAYDDAGSRVLVQPDGKIVIIGRASGASDSQYLAQRLNADGTVDTSFNGGVASVATLPINGSVSGAAFQADGGILVLGAANRSGNFNQFALVRYNADGTLDSSFNGDGVLLQPVRAFNDQGRALLVQADGKILLGGNSGSTSSSGSRDFALVRLNADGTPDTTFNADGNADGIIITALPGNASDVITGLVELPGGGFLAVGTKSAAGVSNSVILAKYNVDGSLDATFGSGGIQSASLSPTSGVVSGNSIMIQADGKIVVTGIEDRGLGDGSSTGFLMRFNADGTPDPTFDGDGKVVVQLDSFIDHVYKAVQQSDGKLLVSGLSFYSGAANYGVVVRFNTDGSVDTTFGNHGVVWSPFPAPADAGYQNLTLDAAGRILVAGFRAHAGTEHPEGNDMIVVRYNTDGTLDTTFNAASSLGGTAGYTENAAAVVLDATAAVNDADLNAQNDYGGATLTLHRQGGASSQDVFGATSGVTFAGGNVSIAATVVGTYTQSAGTLAIAFAGGVTQLQVNTVMSGLTYANTSDAPAASVTIAWTFSDGNTASAQGAGGARSVTGTTTVNITAANDAPTGSLTISGSALVGEQLTAVSSVADADGMGTIAYQWLRGDMPILDATSSSYTVREADIGFALRVTVSYEDAGGTDESVTSASTVQVGVIVTNPPGSHEVNGTPGNDALVAGRGRDKMSGGDGDDSYYVNSSRDTILEEADGGTDSVFSVDHYVLPANVENLAVTGGDDLRATGNGLDNTITGNAGDNKITGGLGADTMTGGGGEDRFVFLSVADGAAISPDVITDFTQEDGDFIDLRAIDPNAGRSGDQPFKFIGSAEFSATNATAQLRFDAETNTLYGSTDADADAEFAVELTGVESLGRDDLLL